MAIAAFADKGFLKSNNKWSFLPRHLTKLSLAFSNKFLGLSVVNNEIYKKRNRKEKKNRKYLLTVRQMQLLKRHVGIGRDLDCRSKQFLSCLSKISSVL